MTIARQDAALVALLIVFTLLGVGFHCFTGSDDLMPFAIVCGIATVAAVDIATIRWRRGN